MEKLQSTLEYFQSRTESFDLEFFLYGLLLTALMSYVLSLIYIRFGDALSNRELFGRNFVVLSMTTMLIITLVKTSLALSLGLVGALSIIRFRAAIKEPEELTYLFLAIAIGLGMGADEPIITMAAFLVIVAILIVRKLVRNRQPEANLYLTIAGVRIDESILDRIQQVIGRYARNVRLRRLDETDTQIEVSFQTQFESLNNLHHCMNKLRGLDQEMKISLVDDRGIGT